MVDTEEVHTENIMHCPKCGHILRKIEKDVKPSEGSIVVGCDMYCDICKDVMMTVFD